MFQDVLNLISVVEKDAPQLEEIWAATQKVVTDLIPSLKAKTMQASKESEEVGKRLKAACEKQLSKTSAEGKIFPGDGSVLKALLQFILTLAPLFFKPTPAPAG